ncbi:MAG: hypothetical protein ACRCZ9_12185 [Fusobacteriaceae bacterium]
MRIKLIGTKDLKISCRNCGAEYVEVDLFDTFNGVSNVGIVTYGRGELVYSIRSIQSSDVLPDCTALHKCVSCGVENENLGFFVKRPNEI